MRIALLALCTLSACFVRAQAQDPWPLERQDRWGTAHAVVGPDPSTFISPWVFKVIPTNGALSNPPSTGADGIGFFGTWTAHTMYKFDWTTGTVLGSFDGLTPVNCTPAIHPNGRVYCRGGNSNGIVFAVNPATMDYDWFFQASIEDSAIIGPDGSIVGTSGPTSYRWNADSGAVVWQHTLGAGTNGASMAFTRDDQKVLVSKGSQVTALNYSDGSQAWNFPADAQTGGPGVAPDGTIVFGTASGRIYGLNPDGTQKWTYLTLAAVERENSPAFSYNGIVYVGSSDARLYAIRTSDGTRIWSVTGNGRVIYSPVVGYDGRIYFQDNAQELLCVSPAGQIIWRVTMPGPAEGSPGIAADGTLFYEWGDLYMIRQTPPKRSLARSPSRRGSY